MPPPGEPEGAAQPNRKCERFWTLPAPVRFTHKCGHWPNAALGANRWYPSVCSHAHSRRGGCCGEPPSFFVCSVRSAISRNISGLSRHSRGRRISVTAISVAAFGPLAGLSISLIRAKAKAVGSSRSLYVPLYRCGDLNHVGGADFNNRFVNLQYATRSQSSRPGSAPTPTPARTRCRRAEGATKCRHWAECFGGGMTGRSCGGSQDRPTLTSHERATAQSITSSERKPRLSLSGLHG